MIKNYETKRAAAICIGTGIACIALSLLSGCGPNPFQGPAGPQGAEGVAGQSTVGAAGSQGVQGQAGGTGPAGSSCSVTSVGINQTAPNGGSLLSCTDGSQSLVLNGTPGDTGATGPTGNQGATGTPGTVVYAVQFCPNVTTSYPNTFAEVAFCINNSLWAVYSQNDGFLTEVVPGTYSSDGINASCTFTVGSNCEISY